MVRSLRVSEEGLKRAKEAFHLTGWTQDYLAGSVECSRPTVSKFFARGDVEKRFFEAICRKLNLRVAEIADLESEEGQVNTSVSLNGNREKSLATLTQKSTETDEEKVSFSILGTASKVDLPKLKALVAHLQKITGDTSIEIVDIDKGSIRLILEGSQESLEQIEALFKSGQLTELEGLAVEDVQFVTPKIPEHDEDIQAIDKQRLAFTIAGSVSSEEIQELKAAFTETSDNEEEIEVGDKARIVQEIITEVAKGRNLIGANLQDAFLRGANLQDADLRGANLQDADLRGANLQDADLSGANLQGAFLSGANLQGAFLQDADLSDANLWGAFLKGARIDVQTKIDSKWRLVWEIVTQGARKQHLIGIDLSDANLQGTNLQGANLQGADLSRTNLQSADLSRADLSRTNLQGADLSRTNLQGTDLQGADLQGADLQGADLSDAVVENAQFGVNLGLTEEIKLDLKQRGAIFEDSPGIAARI